jgi:DNA-binding transcriptional ArsR family regulator
MKSIKRNYFHNKFIKKDSKFQTDLNYSVDEYIKYIHSNKRLSNGLKEANIISSVKISALIAILYAIGSCSKSFCTIAGIEKISEISNLSKRTVSSGLKGLRKAGILIIFHRYKEINGQKRRTTSLTILKAFVDFCEWCKSIKNKSELAIKKYIKPIFTGVKWVGDDETGNLIDFSTGEIIT